MRSNRYPTLLLLIPMALLSVSALAGCAASTKSGVSAPVLLPPIPRAVSTCEAPLLLPETPLTRAQVEQLWARDRGNLVKCGSSLETLQQHYEGLAADLRGAAR